jgi:tetratricopeptide (TPR) repeat protein
MSQKTLLPLIALLALTPVAYAVPDANGNIPARAAGPAAAPRAQAADPVMAVKSYKVGYEEWQMATGLKNAGVGLTGEAGMRNKEAVDAGFTRARDKFRSATNSDPNMKEAWNMLGFTSRMLGNYEDSLAAYEKALALSPDYPEAIEYRAELFLLTGRLAQVKEAYAYLQKSTPSYAEVLKTSMKDWVKAKKATPGVADADRKEFTDWVAKL